MTLDPRASTSDPDVTLRGRFRSGLIVEVQAASGNAGFQCNAHGTALTQVNVIERRILS